MSEPEAVTRARQWIPLHRENRYQKEAAKIMNRLLAAYDELRGEVERLRRWKDEAAEVLIGMQDLGRELNVPLGQRITGEGAAEAARAIVDERDRLAATVERVLGLAVKMTGEHGQSWNTISGRRILAALDEAWDSGSGDPS